MKLLVDTHVALWRLTNNSKLSRAGVEILDRRDVEPMVSAASIWEVAIKWALRRGGPGDMPLSGHEFRHELELARVDILDISAHHAASIDQLPLLHGDPFDRLLLAQARAEGRILITHDATLAEYGRYVLTV